MGELEWPLAQSRDAASPAATKREPETVGTNDADPTWRGDRRTRRQVLRARRAAAAACTQWTTAMTGIFEAYPVDSAAAARRRSWLRGAPLVYARVCPVLHGMQCPVPRAKFARSWRADYLSVRNFRIKLAERQLARMHSPNEFNSFESDSSRNVSIRQIKDRLYTFVYVCASGFVADSRTRMTKASSPHGRGRGVRLVALRASGWSTEPMMRTHTFSTGRARGLRHDC
jgi:hypothetical protein